MGNNKGSEGFAFSQGEIMALRCAVALLVAAHPSKDRLVGLISHMISRSMEDTPEMYKLGIRDVLDSVKEMVDMAALTQEARKAHCADI